MSEWDDMELDEVIQKRNQGVNTTTEKVKYSEAGIKVIRANNISQGRIDYSDCVFVDDETYARIKEPCKPKKGDILYTNIGSQFGNAAKVEVDFEFTIAWNVLRIQPNENVDSDFLVYLLNNPINKSYIQSLNSSSTMPFVSGKDIGKTSFKFPNYEIQKEIGEKLKSLDLKIELNRQTNQTLEHMAQAIFKSWFVNFEPTRAKAQARTHISKGIMLTDDVFTNTLNIADDPQAAGAHQPLAKNFSQSDADQMVERAAMAAICGKSLSELENLPAETLEQLKTTAALFPETLMDSELGEIPEGWTVTRLGDVSTELRRGISPKYTEENGVRVINQKCIRNHSINFDLTRLNDPEKRKIVGREVQLGDVLVNSTGVGTLGRLAPVRYLKDKTVFDSHVTVVRADTNKITKSFLTGLMLEKESFIEGSGAGSTGQTELRKQVLEDIEFANPPLALGEIFETIANPINKKIAAFEMQQKSLSETRDVLLPKLLSGELIN